MFAFVAFCPASHSESSMFDFIRRHNKLFQFLLVLVVFPSFLGCGLVGYARFTEGANSSVAKIDGRYITQAEWDAAQHIQLDRARQHNPTLDAKLFDSPEIKYEVLESLVRERVTDAAVQHLNIVTADQRLRRLFTSDPQLAYLRNADNSLNKDMLAAQGMSQLRFEQRLRDEYSHRQLMAGLD